MRKHTIWTERKLHNLLQHHDNDEVPPQVQRTGAIPYLLQDIFSPPYMLLSKAYLMQGNTQAVAHQSAAQLSSAWERWTTCSSTLATQAGSKKLHLAATPECTGRNKPHSELMLLLITVCRRSATGREGDTTMHIYACTSRCTFLSGAELLDWQCP